MVTKISHFCLSAKIEWLHHELDNFDSTLGVALGLVELKASRTFGQVGELLLLEVVEFRVYLEAIFERFWLFTQPLVLEWNFRIEGEGEESKLISNLFICHNPIFEGRNSSPHLVHVVFMLLQFYCICMFVCVWGILGGIEIGFIKCVFLCFLLEF